VRDYEYKKISFFMLEKINNFIVRNLFLIILIIFCYYFFFGFYRIKPIPLRQFTKKIETEFSPQVMAKSKVLLNSNLNSNLQMNVVNNMIKTFSLSLEVDNVEKTKNEIDNEIEKFSGTIQNFIISDKIYNYSIKIPTKDVVEFITKIKNFGDVKTENANQVNIKSKYNDNTNKIKTLKDRKDRLQQLLIITKDVKVIIDIDRQISYLDDDINRLQDTNNEIDNDIDYTQINISISLKFKALNNIWSLGSSWSRAVDNLVIFIQKFIDLIFNMITFSPFIVFSVFLVKKLKR
jgi:hypothetical protein